MKAKIYSLHSGSVNSQEAAGFQMPSLEELWEEIQSPNQEEASAATLLILDLLKRANAHFPINKTPRNDNEDAQVASKNRERQLEIIETIANRLLESFKSFNAPPDSNIAPGTEKAALKDTSNRQFVGVKKSEFPYFFAGNCWQISDRLRTVFSRTQYYYYPQRNRSTEAEQDKAFVEERGERLRTYP